MDAMLWVAQQKGISFSPFRMGNNRGCFCLPAVPDEGKNAPCAACHLQKTLLVW